jgi:hypothetical protein
MTSRADAVTPIASYALCLGSGRARRRSSALGHALSTDGPYAFRAFSQALTS